MRSNDDNNFNGVGEEDFIFSLPRAQSPIYGIHRLDQTTFNLLIQNKLSFNIRSTTHPRGEIRGGITNYKYPFYAYLSGTRVVPTKRTTSAIGCATFRIMEELSDGTTVLDYDIQHNVFDPIGVDMFVGPDGTEGEFNRQFIRTSSPVSGVNEYLDAATLNLFRTDRTFIQIRSNRFFDDDQGEIRGQVFHVLDIPCSAPLPETTIDVLSTNADPPPDWGLPPLESRAFDSFSLFSFFSLLLAALLALLV